MTPPPLPLLTPALAAAVLGLAPFAAHAQIVAASGSTTAQIRSSDYFMYTDDKNEALSGPPLLTTTGTAGVVGDGSNNAGFADGNWQAYAGWDRLGVRASAEAAASLPVGSSYDYSRSFAETTSYASLSFNDLVITGPGDSATISLNLLFNSSMAGGLDIAAGGGLGSSYVSLGADVSGAMAKSGDFSGNWTLLDFPWALSEYSTGILGPDYRGGPAELTTGLWEVPTGAPLNLVLTLQASSYLDLSAYSATEVSGSMMMDAFHSLSFPVGSPVFNLPDGYTANAPSYGIVDNLLAPIPEPGEYAALAGLGLLGFALWRRARRACADFARFPHQPRDRHDVPPRPSTPGNPGRRRMPRPPIYPTTENDMIRTPIATNRPVNDARRGLGRGKRWAVTTRLGLAAALLGAANTGLAQLFGGVQVGSSASGAWIDGPYGYVDPTRSGMQQYYPGWTSLPADSGVAQWDTAASAFASADLRTGKLRASAVTATPPIRSGSSESPTGYLVGSGWGGSSAFASASWSDVITVVGDFTQEAWGTVRIHLKGSLEIAQEPYVVYRYEAPEYPTDFGGGYASFSFNSTLNSVPGAPTERRELTIRTPSENAVIDEVIEQRFRLNDLSSNWPYQSPDPKTQRYLFLNSGLFAGTWFGGEGVNFQNTATFELDLPPGYSFTSDLGFLSAIPEPHEYALLLAAGLLGFALWRRARRA